MVKRDKNFKLSKEVKRQMALMPSEKRNLYKNMMIDAQLAASAPFKSEKRNRKETSE